MRKIEILIFILIGYLLGLISIIAVSNTQWQRGQLAKTAIEQCEEFLPRNVKCEITAKVVKN